MKAILIFIFWNYNSQSHSLCSLFCFSSSYTHLIKVCIKAFENESYVEGKIQIFLKQNRMIIEENLHLIKFMSSFQGKATELNLKHLWLKYLFWQKYQFILSYISITELYAFELQGINLFPTQRAFLKYLML